jgi:hypothetical protein
MTWVFGIGPLRQFSTREGTGRRAGKGKERVYKADEGSLHFEMNAGRVMGLEYR